MMNVHAKLKTKEYSVRDLLKKMNVKLSVLQMIRLIPWNITKNYLKRMAFKK